MPDRPKAGSVETRAAELSTEGRRIRGIVPFNVESRDMGGWKEVISPSALRNAKLDDLIARVDHAGVPIGRFPKTLEVEERSDGLHWSVTPPESRADLLEAIERGDLQAGSWQMIVDKDRWQGDVRHVESIAELRDVSVVSTPSYPSASIEYRSAPTTPADEPEKAVTDMSEDTSEAREKTAAPEAEETRAAPEVKTEPEKIPAGSLRVEDRTEVPAESLADLFEKRGFFENRSASVGWDEFRAFTWTGGTAVSDISPLRADGVPLGYDSRWLYPVLPNQAVSAETTSVQFLRQSARSLAAGTAVIRALDAVSQKPETSSTAELVTQQLSQVATVQSNVPRIHSNQPLFADLVETDLRLAVSDGFDQLVRTGVNTAGTAAAVTGSQIDKLRKAITVIQSNGYSPDTVAIDPAGAEALDLTKSSGSEAFYTFGAGQFAPGSIFGLNVRVWKSAGTAVLDSRSFGTLYSTPLELRAFEADGGLTNRSNYRLEANATFAVQRTAAALRVN